MSRERKNKIKTKHITLLIKIIMITIIALLFIGPKSHAYIPSEFQNETTIQSSSSSTQLKRSYNVSYYLGDDVEIDMRRLQYYQEVICGEKGAPMISEYSATRPGKDATVEVGGRKYVKKQVEDGDKVGQYTANGKDAVSRYGEVGTVVDTSRTIGIYNKTSEGPLSASAAYVRAHTEKTDTYPGTVQQASWILQANTDTALPNLTGDLD